MANWATIRLTYNDWGRSYKRDLHVHSHQLQQAFRTAALNDALVELRATYPNVQQNQIGQGPMQVNLPNDPGAGYRAI